MSEPTPVVSFGVVGVGDCLADVATGSDALVGFNVSEVADEVDATALDCDRVPRRANLPRPARHLGVGAVAAHALRAGPETDDLAVLALGAERQRGKELVEALGVFEVLGVGAGVEGGAMRGEGPDNDAGDDGV
ncbi:hypothetical protein G3M48_003337 [Beauveria asiatica]|uniref:Uncharacterized protein n=1 Tax=Beauveria asiatica TaxID=1069075 RepID=A0AAW0S7Y5_9HYPO